jgi:probable rRNA maturation factor
MAARKPATARPAAARLARDLARLTALARAAARRPVRLELALLDDREMAALHRRHLGVPGTTDVLSYALQDGPEGLHGALAVGWEVARREALRRGHPPYHEALLYAVHGTLHLLGHDDHAPRDRARMRRAERRWLAALGLGDVFGGGSSR